MPDGRSEIERAQAEQLAAYLRTMYRDAKVLPDGSVAVLMDLIYTRAIGLGACEMSFHSRFCFSDRELASQRFAELQSEDDVPEGHIATRGPLRPR